MMTFLLGLVVALAFVSAGYLGWLLADFIMRLPFNK